MPRRIVVPGELVTSERKRIGKHVYLRDGSIFSDSVGLVSESDTTVSVIPLEGKYEAEINDVIVGVIMDEKISGYTVNLDSFYPSYISKKALRDPLKPASVVSAKVMGINELKEIEIGGVRVLFGGEILNVSPVKVPRVIGKDGSMLEVLKSGTGCMLVVGRNGLIWVKGGNVKLLQGALDLIQREAHADNLTAKVSNFLSPKGSVKGAQVPTPLGEDSFA
ncbi:MAG: hypothetical protein Q7K34_02485 [archaeon]|nr:hypothetical protein [archaeon]